MVATDKLQVQEDIPNVKIMFIKTRGKALHYKPVSHICRTKGNNLKSDEV